MNILDMIIVLIVIVCMYQSYRAGFLDELLTIIFFCLSAYFAFILSPLLLPYLGFISQRYMIMKAAGILIFFIAFYIIGKIIKQFILDFIDETELNGFDRFIGMCLGLLKGLVLVCVLVFLFSYIHFDPVKDLVSESFLSGHILAAISKYKTIIII